MEKQNMSRLFTREIAVQAIKDSFIKLNPSALVKNPVIFIVGIGALMTTVVVILDISCRTFFIFQFSDNIMALVYRLVCQFCRSGC